MKRVITYGTFDLLHNGHINILKRAKSMGDYLIVGVTSDNYDQSRGKLNVCQTLSERIENVKKTGLADEIIVEEYLGQKVEDVQKYNVDTFVIGSDWLNKFDYLKEYCEVVYLPRTPGVSSTEIRNNKSGIVNIGIVGNGRIAKRFVKETKFVSGINVSCVYGRNVDHIKQFANDFELDSYYTNYDELLDNVDAIYIATPHVTHYDYAKKAIERGKHVLCEKPMCLKGEEAKELFELAEKNGVVLYEAIKTAYSPAFLRLINIAKSGYIGNIKNITAAFTKLISDKTLREYNKALGGGAFNELGSYMLLPVIKLLGCEYKDLHFTTMFDEKTEVDILTKLNITYNNSMATLTTSIGTKQEGDLVISGTNGYIYVPAPWWKTEYFEIRFEDLSKTLKYFYKFEGDGLRYEIADFITSINGKQKSYKLSNEESTAFAKVFETFADNIKTKQNIDYIKY